MRTLIVSDLHLGSRGGVDLLRRPQLREPLLARLADADRLVLLGDVLELRHGPHRDAVAAARNLFEDLERTFAGREVVVVAGNHDYPLAAGWLRARAEHQAPPPLTPEQRFGAAEASATLAALAGFAPSVRVSAAYPGLWLRPDVYATHGHYLDCHLTVPTLERLAIGVMSRVMRRPLETLRCVDDYEAVTGPLFALVDAIAAYEPTGDALSGQITVRAWRALRPVGRPSLLQRAAAGSFPLGVAALNRAGLGPVRPDVSSSELRRSALRAMGQVAQRLDLGAAHVIFGHTHRAGPLARDEWQQWTGPSGASLINAGCWSYDGWFLGPDSSTRNPYWPGACVVVEDQGAPRLERLLDGFSVEQIAPRPLVSA
jgi:predicted phosphodiesterase